MNCSRRVCDSKWHPFNHALPLTKLLQWNVIAAHESLLEAIKNDYNFSFWAVLLDQFSIRLVII